MFEVGDRVISNDPGLAKLRQIMIDAGFDHEPNNIGTVKKVLGDLIMVQWDGEDGLLSPHPSNLLEKLEEEGE